MLVYAKADQDRIRSDYNEAMTRCVQTELVPTEVTVISDAEFEALLLKDTAQ